MIVAFEVLSPSSRTRDLRWKRQAYAALPTLQHYVVLHQNRLDIRCYDRATGWAEHLLEGEDAELRLGGIDTVLATRTLYAGTGLV